MFDRSDTQNITKQALKIEPLWGKGSEVAPGTAGEEV